jgi:hypothetical protein
MDEIRINPEEMESGDAREGGRQGLDDATFDPNASIEQSGDFRQAESTQNLMADLTNDAVPEQRTAPREQHPPGPESKSHSNSSSHSKISSHGPGISGNNNRGTVEARALEPIPGREETVDVHEAPNRTEAALPRKPSARQAFLETHKGAAKKAHEPFLGKPSEESGDQDGPVNGLEDSDTTTEHQDVWEGQS